jgi:hypothetical protein
MSRLWRWLKLLVFLALAVLALYAVLALVFMDFMVDWWWFRSLGYEAYFWLRLSYRYLLLGGFTLLFFLVFFLNFWVASRFLGAATPDPGQSPESISRTRRLITRFRTGSMWVYTPFSLLLASLIAFILYRKWEETLLFLFAPEAGLQDQVYGKDISYFLFRLPIYLSLMDTLVATLFFLFVGLLLLYWLERRLLVRQDERLPRGAKLHLSLVIFLLVAMGVWNFFLQRHSLLYVSTHSTIFQGPGFVEMRVILPLIWACIVLLAATGFFLIAYLNTRRRLKPLLLCVLLLALALAGRYSDYLPQLVQRYIVLPNEISRERPFIEHNINATLSAWDLNQVERREYLIKEPTAWDYGSVRAKINLRNIPVWDREILRSVYEQLQQLRTYYKFSTVTVDRYTVGEVYQQVYLAPREISLTDLPAGVKNWINERLKYTHGYGVVMTPAAQGGEEPMTWFIQDIPARSEFGFKLAQPAVYFGLLDHGYVIAPNESREIHYPTEEGNNLTDYTGADGIPINSLFRRVFFSLYLKESNILFTAKTIPQSRILIRRNIVQRIKALTPFFRLDSDPYLVITDQGMFWIQDAYTSSTRYPYAQFTDQGVNYMRNSVKIVVDAYNGTVHYYLADPRDPIIQAYRRMYPGLIKGLEEMPAGLKAHLRYPKDLFDIQAGIYAKYHQTNPDIFYKQEDLWEFPIIQHQGKETRIKPYYLTLNLITPDKFEFLMVCPMTPRARTNLRSILVVGSDGANYGKFFAFNFPKGVMAYGPSQVDAFIDQDTRISEQFTLWGQLGSQVERGRMILLPAKDSIFYIQPVYLKSASGLQIPQLKRLILNLGEITVMEPSLEEGLARLEERFKELSERAKRRLEPPRTEPESPEKKPGEPGPPPAVPPEKPQP